jgi:hypothetical protein
MRQATCQRERTSHSPARRVGSAARPERQNLMHHQRDAGVGSAMGEDVSVMPGGIVDRTASFEVSKGPLELAALEERNSMQLAALDRPRVVVGMRVGKP